MSTKQLRRAALIALAFLLAMTLFWYVLPALWGGT